MKRVDVVQVARDRIAEIDRMQAEQEAERSKLREFVALAEKLQLGQGQEVGVAVTQLANAMSTPTPVAEIRRRAANILGCRDEPMPLADLCAELVRSGVVIGGKDPRSNLSAKLSGAEEFESIPGKGWVLRQELGPAAETARPYVNGAGASG